ncbi:hypothetical protein MKZ38_002835 [Zalerion maritima]|uniref:Metallo-beta-lactamase domain-containing protein n=1 Tax=Zalerion maritima TaxID=339359 RepID=A0AAD5RYH8_9PEZI|nr:hypothetical protein MKZ38_002835 [Zalerion maritima]
MVADLPDALDPSGWGNATTFPARPPSITMALKFTLAPLASIQITSIVTDEVDHFTPSPSPLVGKAPGLIGGAVPLPEPRCGASHELKMDRLCCGALGLSLGISAVPADGVGGQGRKPRELLFDAGPLGDLWARNASNMGYDAGKVEHVHLSHWHRDHSAGLEDAVRMIAERKKEADGQVVVDLHPDVVVYRGMKTPKGVVSMEANPTVGTLEEAGAKVELNGDAHLVLDGTFLVSGQIPRVTEYEGGIQGGVRLNEDGEWVEDELIMDERMVVCLLKDKGLVIFTGCSHAGVINVCLHAKEIFPDTPIYCVVGGYHLADATPERLGSSLEDLMKLEPMLCMPGHCTGWRFKFMIEKEMPGQMVPLVAGGKQYQAVPELKANSDIDHIKGNE